MLVRCFSFNSAFAKTRLLSQDGFRGTRLSTSKYFRCRVTRALYNPFVLLALPLRVNSCRVFTSSNRNQVITGAFTLRFNVLRLMVMFIFQRFRLYFALSTRTRFFFIRHRAFFRTYRFMVNFRYLLFRTRTFLFRFSFFLLVDSTLLLPIIPLIFSTARRIQVQRNRGHVSFLRRATFLNCSALCTSHFANICFGNRGELCRSFRVSMFRGLIVFSFNCLCIFQLSTRLTQPNQRGSSMGGRDSGYGSSNCMRFVTSVPKFLFGFGVRVVLFFQFTICGSNRSVDESWFSMDNILPSGSGEMELHGIWCELR